MGLTGTLLLALALGDALQREFEFGDGVPMIRWRRRRVCTALAWVSRTRRVARNHAKRGCCPPELLPDVHQEGEFAVAAEVAPRILRELDVQIDAEQATVDCSEWELCHRLNPCEVTAPSFPRSFTWVHFAEVMEFFEL